MNIFLCIAIITMGISGLVAEIVLLRELLIVFSGNELSIGIILANWLILEAFGCFFAGRRTERSENRLAEFTVITILFSLSFLTAIVMTRMLKGMIGVSIGENVGFLPILSFSFLILLLPSIFHGALFTYSCRLYSSFSGRDASSAGMVYVYETIGTIIGGVACTYLIVLYLNAFQVAIGLAALNGVVCLALLAPSWRTGRIHKVLPVLLSMIVIISGYCLFSGQAEKLHRYTIQAQWKNHTIVHYQNSLYGNICIIENQEQYIFFLDGIPAIITPVPDIQFVEEFVHLPLLAHPEPANILIVSGGVGGIIQETLKHPCVKSIVYTEHDSLLLDLLRKFPTALTESELNDPRVTVKNTDGRLLLRTTPQKYDVIFIGTFEPSNLQANRYFTETFFSLASDRLNEGGILVLGLPGSLTFLNQELKNLNSTIFLTLQTVFPHIRVIPGDGKNLFLASETRHVDTFDQMQVINRLIERNISADAMVPWHIEKKLHHGWQGWFSHFLEGSSQKLNQDFRPLGVFYSITHWNALYAPSFGMLFNQLEQVDLKTIALAIAFLLAIYFTQRLKSMRTLRAGIPLSIATTGLAGMVFSLIVIFAFQSMYGYVFAWIGLLIASFMAGAASGAMLMTAALTRIRNGFRLFKAIELAILVFSLCLPFVFFRVIDAGSSEAAFLLFRLVFLLVSFVCGLLIGSQFPLAIRIYLGNSESISRTASLLYAADLLGGWFGGIVGAAVLLPVLGLTGTCVTMALLKLMSFIVIASEPVELGRN